MFFKKKSAAQQQHTRILYASDFHGSEAFWRKFLTSARQYQANALITGGDLTGKAMVPIVNQGGGKYRGFLFGRKETPSTPEELEKLKSTISNVGFYPIVLEPDEAAELESNPDTLDRRFEAEMCARIRRWLELYVEKLGGENIPLYFMPGNDDLFSIDPIIAEFSGANVYNPDGQRFWLDDNHELVGMSNSNVTPWHCIRDTPEEILEQKLQQLAALLEKPRQAVMALHVPPYNAGIDVCPELDENLKIVARGGQVMMKPVGSTAVRKIIEQVQPLLSLHGHIHEAAGHTRIGSTLCINAGSEYAEGIMKAAIINLEPDRIKGHVLISG